MNQALVAAKPCSSFAVVCDVIDAISFGNDVVSDFDGFCFFWIFVLPQAVSCSDEKCVPHFSESVDIIDLRTDMFTGLQWLVDEIKSFACTEQDFSLFSFHNVCHGIERFWAVYMKMCKRTAVEPTDAVERTEPHHSLAVFKYFVYRIIGQTI